MFGYGIVNGCDFSKANAQDLKFSICQYTFMNEEIKLGQKIAYNNLKAFLNIFKN